jgi:indole-3-glycerol phosphate synthase
VQQCRAAVSLAQLEARIQTAPPPRDFVGALQAKLAAGSFGLIAEMKRVSPSAGLIRPEFDVTIIAAAYKAGGAACLSVLTDQPFFKGRDRDISEAADAGLPILRKDFMLDVYQIAEARAIGADAVLLIMAALDDSAVAELHAAAIHYGLAVLIETHDERELERALHLTSGMSKIMIGINNRDLKTLRTDLSTTARLVAQIPPERRTDLLLVSESGLRDHADLCRMRDHGVNFFLVGEHLLKQPDLAKATREMLRVS